MKNRADPTHRTGRDRTCDCCTTSTALLRGVFLRATPSCGPYSTPLDACCATFLSDASSPLKLHRDASDWHEGEDAESAGGATLYRVAPVCIPVRVCPNAPISRLLPPREGFGRCCCGLLELQRRCFRVECRQCTGLRSLRSSSHRWYAAVRRDRRGDPSRRIPTLAHLMWSTSASLSNPHAPRRRSLHSGWPALGDHGSFRHPRTAACKVHLDPASCVSPGNTAAAASTGLQNSGEYA